ncbi:hypothetical protein GCM10027567_32550 [Spongiibacter taiwanensis]
MLCIAAWENLTLKPGKLKRLTNVDSENYSRVFALGKSLVTDFYVIWVNQWWPAKAAE